MIISIPVLNRKSPFFVFVEYFNTLSLLSGTISDPTPSVGTTSQPPTPPSPTPTVSGSPTPTNFSIDLNVTVTELPPNTTAPTTPAPGMTDNFGNRFNRYPFPCHFPFPFRGIIFVRRLPHAVNSVSLNGFCKACCRHYMYTSRFLDSNKRTYCHMSITNVWKENDN